MVAGSPAQVIITGGGGGGSGPGGSVGGGRGGGSCPPSCISESTFVLAASCSCSASCNPSWSCRPKLAASSLYYVVGLLLHCCGRLKPQYNTVSKTVVFT
jgi:hypothetical protein